MSGFLQSSNGNVNLQESNAFKHNNNNSNNSSKKVMEMEDWVVHMRELLVIARDAELEEAENGLKERLAEAAKAEQDDNNINQNINKQILERHRSCRKSLGPLIVNESETGLFGRCLTSFKIPGTNSLGHHKISVGDIVAVSPYRAKSINPDNLPRGIVTRVKTNEIIVAFDEDIPDEYFSQTLYLNKLGNEVTWKRLNEALQTVRTYSGGFAQRVANVAFGLQCSESSPMENVNIGSKQKFDPFNKSLNDSQIKAINASLSTKDLCVIHGPPGTGKTTTVVELVHQAIKKGLSVLACAPSNIAVDNMVERLARPIRDPKTNKLITPAKIVRIGHPARLTKNVLKHCLEAHIEKAEGTDLITGIKKDISEHIKSLRNNKLKSKVTKQLFGDDSNSTNKNIVPKHAKDSSNSVNGKKSGKLSRNERNTIRYEIQALRKEIRTREDAVVKNIINEANVVLGTTIGIAGRVLSKKDAPFDLVIIDEAAQALEAECWLAILKGRRCILAGDHCQLPPTIMSDEAARKGLGVTLMDRIVQSSKANNKDTGKTKNLFRRSNNTYNKVSIRTKPILNVPVVMLNIQYRMHDSICQWASKAMYSGALRSHEHVAKHLLPDLVHVNSVRYESYFQSDSAMALVDTAGCDGFEEMEDIERGSKANPGEAKLVLAYVDRMLACGLMEKDIAIITPYNGQVNLLRSAMLEKYPAIEVRSVDGFQGREKECIIMSLVRSNVNKKVGFLADKRRINVAVTRARRHIAIICDSDTVKSDKFLSGMLKHIETMTHNTDIISAIEFENELINSSFNDVINTITIGSLVESSANIVVTKKTFVTPGSSSNIGKGTVLNMNKDGLKKKRNKPASSASNNSSKKSKEQIEQERLKRMDELTKQLQEINKASEVGTEVEEEMSTVGELKKDKVKQSTSKTSILHHDNTSGPEVQDQLAQIRIKMAEEYSKSVAKATTSKKKKKKKKKKSSNRSDSSFSSSNKSITKGVLDKDLSENQLLEQLIRENEIVKPRSRPNFLNNNKSEALPSYISKKLENKLKVKSMHRQTENAKKIREDIAKKRAAAAKKKKKR